MTDVMDDIVFKPDPKKAKPKKKTDEEGAGKRGGGAQPLPLNHGAYGLDVPPQLYDGEVSREQHRITTSPPRPTYPPTHRTVATARPPSYHAIIATTPLPPAHPPHPSHHITLQPMHDQSMPYDGGNVAKFSKNVVEVEDAPKGPVTTFIHPPNAWEDADPLARKHGEDSSKSLGWVKNVVLGGKRRELPYLLPCHDKLIHRHTDMSAKDTLERRWASCTAAPHPRRTSTRAHQRVHTSAPPPTLFQPTNPSTHDQPTTDPPTH